MTAVGAPAGCGGRRVPTPVLWVGDVPWGHPDGAANQRCVRAWADGGALVLYLDPDPGPLRWSGRVPPSGSGDDVGAQVWREFLAAWIHDGMRADGPVWVLPWVRSLVCADGVARHEAAAIVEGLAELAEKRPVVVAREAGRWTGRSPAVSVVHRPACLGDPPAWVEPDWRAEPVPWTEPWLHVVIWATPAENLWVDHIAAVVPEARVHAIGMTSGAESPPIEKRLAAAAALVVSPGRMVEAGELLPQWLRQNPRLRVVGPPPVRGLGAERVLPAGTVRQYARALGAAVWLLPSRDPITAPWEPLWQALAQAPCGRCRA